MSVVIKSKARADLHKKTYFCIALYRDQKKDKKIQFNCFDTRDNSRLLELVVDDYEYSYIDGFFDGDNYFVARDSNRIDCICADGTTLWSISINIDLNAIVGDIIFSISNYSDDYMLCALDGSIGKIMFLSKDSGSIVGAVDTDGDVNDFFISSNYKYYAVAGDLYALNFKKSIKIHSGSGYIRSVDAIDEFIYIAWAQRVKLIAHKKVIHSMCVECVFILDILIVEDGLAVLSKSEIQDTYLISLYDRNMVSRHNSREFHSVNLPFFIREGRSVVACVIDGSVDDNLYGPPKISIINVIF